MANIFELVGSITLKGQEKVQQQLLGTENRAKKVSISLRKVGLGLAAMGTAIVAGMGLALKAAADFETAMREVNTMMGLNQEGFKAFSKDVLKLAGDLGVDAVESAEALYQAISAGVPKENVLTFLEIATKAAIGGVTSTKVAVDGLTTVINAFKLPMSDAQKVADIMFTTVKGGKTTMEELSASMFQVAPIAAASGVKFEEVAAALATMTKQGVPTTVATTQLRQAMVALQKPTADMNKVIKGLGYESGQTMLEEKGLAGTLDILREATGGSNEMLMKMFGSVEAGQAVLSLTGDNMEMFTTDLRAMENATGAATDAFEEMERSTSRQMQKLKASFSSMAISVGTFLLPILTDVVAKIQPIIDSMRIWAEEHPGLTKVIVIGTAAFGGLLIALGSLLLMLPMVTTAVATFGVVLSAAIWPITLVVGSIGLLVAAGVLLWQKWQEVVDFFKLAWINIPIFFLTGIEKILGALARFTNWLPIFGDKIQQAHDAISNMIDVKEVKKRALQVEDTLDSIATHWHKGADAISYQWHKTAEAISFQSHTIALAMEEVTDAVDDASEAIDGTRVALARAQWEIDGATYSTALYTKEEIKLAEEAGKKVTILEGQTRAIIDGADAAEDAAARLAELAAAEAAIAAAAAAATPAPAGGGIGGGAGGGRGPQLDVGMLSDEQRAEYERILAAAPGEFTPESLLKLMLLGLEGSLIKMVEGIPSIEIKGIPVPLANLEHGGLITEPTWLTRVGETRPYATMAEKRPEYISSGIPSIDIHDNVFNVRDDEDIHRLAEEIAEETVNQIRTRTGAKR